MGNLGKLANRVSGVSGVREIIWVTHPSWVSGRCGELCQLSVLFKSANWISQIEQVSLCWLHQLDIRPVHLVSSVN